MKWFIAFIMVLTAYAGPAGGPLGYAFDPTAESATSRSIAVDREAAGPGVYAMAVIARHWCPGSSGKTGPAGSAACISDIGYVPVRQFEALRQASQLRSLHSSEIKPGASSRPLFRPPILTV